MNFSKELAEKILLNKIDASKLAEMYPEISDSVIKDFSNLKENSTTNDFSNLITKYKTKASFAISKINKSGLSSQAINTFLPDIIKSRIAIKFLEKVNFSIQTNEYSGKVRFNLWDGLILQKLLFKKGLERKLVSVKKFKLVWPFIIKKKILMPLVNAKGIYCFYSKELVREFKKLIGDSSCLEIGAGDGVLTQFLINEEINCIATDNYSWDNYIKYPSFVKRLDGKSALEKYKTDTVICSWPPPENNFEKHVFSSNSVKLYIVIGTKNKLYSGNHKVYETQENFTMELNEKLSSLILPPSKDNAVYIFRRK